MMNVRLHTRLWVVIVLAIAAACSMLAYPAILRHYWMSKVRGAPVTQLKALLAEAKDMPPTLAAEAVLWRADKVVLSPRNDWKSSPLVRSYDDTGTLCEALIQIGSPCLSVIVASVARDYDAQAEVQSVRFVIAYTALVNIEDKCPGSWPSCGSFEGARVTLAEMQALLSDHAQDDTQVPEVREAATEGLQRIGRLRASEAKG